MIDTVIIGITLIAALVAILFGYIVGGLIRFDISKMSNLSSIGLLLLFAIGLTLASISDTTLTGIGVVLSGILGGIFLRGKRK